MKDPMTDAFESLERAHIESGARMMRPTSRAEELIADLEAEIVKRDARIAELERYRAAFNEWHDKTQWVQEEVHSGVIRAKALGYHRADVMAYLIKTLRSELEQQPGECVAVPRDVMADLVSLDREKRISGERHLYALLAQQGD